MRATILFLLAHGFAQYDSFSLHSSLESYTENLLTATAYDPTPDETTTATDIGVPSISSSSDAVDTETSSVAAPSVTSSPLPEASTTSTASTSKSSSAGTLGGLTSSLESTSSDLIQTSHFTSTRASSLALSLPSSWSNSSVSYHRVTAVVNVTQTHFATASVSQCGTSSLLVSNGSGKLSISLVACMVGLALLFMV